LGYVIDSPVNVHSTEAEIAAWITELKKLPRTDLAVQSALKQARDLLVLVKKAE